MRSQTHKSTLKNQFLFYCKSIFEKKASTYSTIPFLLALILLLPSFTCRAAFPLVSDHRTAPIASTSFHRETETASVQRYEFKNTAATPKNYKTRSGIFGRLSLYFGLLSFIGFIAALLSIGSPLLSTWLVVWLYGATFAVISGLIGLRHRRKKGMAIGGITIGVLQFILLAAIASFLSAVAAALPGIMAAIIIFGHGA